MRTCVSWPLRRPGQMKGDAKTAVEAAKEAAEKDKDPDVKCVAKNAIEKITAKP